MCFICCGGNNWWEISIFILINNRILIWMRILEQMSVKKHYSFTNRKRQSWLLNFSWTVVHLLSDKVAISVKLLNFPATSPIIGIWCNLKFVWRSLVRHIDCLDYLAQTTPLQALSMFCVKSKCLVPVSCVRLLPFNGFRSSRRCCILSGAMWPTEAKSVP